MENYTRTDFFLDPGVTIKQEVIDTNVYNTSASVPIPARRTMDYHGLTFDLDSSQSPSYQDVSLMDDTHQSNDSGTMWGTRMPLELEVTKNESLIHMDDDDIFQVDKADLIQGPTLAELNANDETLLGDLNFDDLLLPEEGSYSYSNNLPKSFVQLNNNICIPRMNNNNQPLTVQSCPQTGLGYYRDMSDLVSLNAYNAFPANKSAIPAFSPVSQSQNSSTSSLHLRPNTPIMSSPGTMSPMQQKHSTLHELLMKKEKGDVSPDHTVLGQSVPAPNVSAAGVVGSTMRVPRGPVSRLSSSAPTHLGLEQIWQRREPRKHLLSTGSLAEAGSTSSLSTGGVLSPDPQDFSHDEFDSDEDSDHYEDFSSDNGDSDDDDDQVSSRHSSGTSGSKKERFFWQYNVQAKGPKGQRLVMKAKMEDPHVLNEVTDPVFSPDCAMRGIKHSGKARKGDGNDLTPNPRKLYNIGKELDKLGRIINDMTPVSELPYNVRPTSRKEKNKLASRACRLKKKAQHEANKIKLQGLESEHKRLLNGISQAKQVLAAKFNEPSAEFQDELSLRLDKISKVATKIKIAGHTTDYVNKVLEKLKMTSGSHVVSLDDL